MARIHFYHSEVLDRLSAAVGLVRANGENNEDFLTRIKCYYGQREYQKELPLLSLLWKLNIKSTQNFLATVP